MIRVLVVDDHAIVRTGIGRVLEAEPDIQVVGCAGTGRDGVRLCRELRPDVLVLDFVLSDLDAIGVLHLLASEPRPTAVLVLTMHDNPEYATRALHAGARGFLAKAASAHDLVAAVRRVAAGGVSLPPGVVDRLVRDIQKPAEASPEAALSEREMQVLLRLARGQTTREVAQGLHLSVSTIETHRARLLAKLGLRNNSELTRFAIRRGLIEA